MKSMKRIIEISFISKDVGKSEFQERAEDMYVVNNERDETGHSVIMFNELLNYAPTFLCFFKYRLVSSLCFVLLKARNFACAHSGVIRTPDTGD